MIAHMTYEGDDPLKPRSISAPISRCDAVALASSSAGVVDSPGGGMIAEALSFGDAARASFVVGMQSSGSWKANDQKSQDLDEG